MRSPLDEINVADPELFRTDTMWPLLRAACGAEDPGPLPSVTDSTRIGLLDQGGQGVG